VSTARANRRRRGVLRLAALIVGVIVIVVVIVVVTGKVIVPGISGKMYPIHYQKDIATVAQKYDIDPYLLTAVARTESGFDPSAQSHAGAVGLMQLLPSTAKWVTGLDSWKGPKNPALTSPVDSLELGACYLAYLQGSFDNPVAALAAYNAGQGIVRQWVKSAGGSDSFGSEDIQYAETREFVSRVQQAKARFEKAHPDAFSVD
jgi:soluble lytic murein transglycosylase